MSSARQARSPAQYLKLMLKGMLMGAADAVPGVSGGTIAFITGIYEELIHSIRQCDLGALKTLKNQGLSAFWEQVNGNFLVVLLSGILLSLILFANLVLYLLDQHTVLLWSFFFGLILASIWLVTRPIDSWNPNRSSAFILGAVLAFVITELTPGYAEPTLLLIFFSGMIAICAMILPGISGSFILLLLGMYTVILTAVRDFDLVTLSVFMLGCVIGLLSFSRLLSWAFNHYRQMTLALLGGFLLGSLNKVWPWKYTLSYRINSSGEEVPLVQRNVFPQVYQDLTGSESQLMLALVLALIGIAAVLILEKHSS